MSDVAVPSSAAGPDVVPDRETRLRELRGRLASGERFRGPLASSFYNAVHAIDPTATEDTIAPLTGNGQVNIYRSLLAWASIMPGERIIDIGCGSGGAARAAADIVGPTGMVVGIDPCARTLEVARQRTPDDLPIAYLNVAAERMVGIEDKGFDCAVASLSLEEFQDLPAALTEIRRVLRPGGRFVASVSAFDRLRPVDSAFMGAVMAVIARHVPAGLSGRATRASIPLEPDDARAFSDAGFLRPEERDVQLPAILETEDDAWALFGRTHIAYMLDEEGQEDLRATLARRVPQTIYIPLRFLRSRRPG